MGASTTVSAQPFVPTAALAPASAAPMKQGTGQGRGGFHGPSFLGGMIMAFGLMAISLVTFKFYKARTERNYLTL
jgi:CD164 antigen